MKFPTGGKAREPRGMIRCNSEADSIVWMKEGNLLGIKIFLFLFIGVCALMFFTSGLFSLIYYK